MMIVQRHPLPVNLTRCDLAGVQFHDSGGTNGWIAEPLPNWAQPFVQQLGLPGKIVRIVLRKLPAGQGIPVHLDERRYQTPGVRERRWHVPLITHPSVLMRWPNVGVSAHLEVGWLYEVNHFEPHEIVNESPVDRVHLCLDTVEYERAVA